jgi:hypothetical protein
MGLHLNELTRSFRRYTIFWLVMVVVLTLSIVLMNAIFTDTMNNYQNKIMFQNNYTNKSIIYTDFEDLNECTHMLQRQPEKMGSFYAFRQAMREVPGIRTYNAKTMQWGIEDDWPDLPNEFFVGYRDGQLRQAPDGTQIKNLRVLMISDEFIDEYDIQLSEGRYMSPDSYRYESGKPVDTLLGAAYKGYFEIGDRMTLESINTIELEVVGFIEPQSMYPEMSGIIQLLDNIVVLPGFTSFGAVEKSPILFESMFALQLTAPIVIVEDPTIDVFELVNLMAVQFDIPPLNTIQVQHENINMLKSVTGQQFNLTVTLALIVLLVDIATLSILIGSKIRSNMKAYSIYMLSGGSPGQILRMTMSEILLQLVPAYFLALNISILMYTVRFAGYYARLSIFISAFILLLTLVIALQKTRRIRVAETIRRGHA